MKKFLKAIAAVLLAAAQLTAGAAEPAFDLQGHRGARALLPENSLPGFAHALGLGVSTLELDIAITKDRVLLISHDPALSPDITRGPDGQFLPGRGPVIFTLMASEVQLYDVGRIKPGSNYARTFSGQQPMDGVRIPKLADLFALVKKSGNSEVRFAIETKITPQAPDETVGPEEFARAVIAAIRETGMEGRSSILSFDWRTLQVVQREAPKIPTVYLSMQRPNAIDNIRADSPEGSPWTAGFQFKDHGSVPRMIKAAGGHTWSCHWNDLNADKVKEAHALGLQVLAWTVNNAAEMARFIDMGVDGIVTDRPDLLRQEMQKRGMPLPRPTPVTP